jgi:hypothetical protein
MIDRCYNGNASYYPKYGGRGIKVCDRWLGDKGFQNFLEDMGRKPSPKHSIDRIDNNAGYSPENCRWATAKEQGRNTRWNVNFTYAGKTQCIEAWAEEFRINSATLSGRIRRGWSFERALTTEVKKQKCQKLI